MGRYINLKIGYVYYTLSFMHIYTCISCHPEEFDNICIPLLKKEV